MSELFNYDDSSSSSAISKNELRGKFFSTPEIRDYLARDSKTLTFKDDHPDLVSDDKNKEKSDYYELEIYRLLKDRLPYRGYVETSSFYFEGTHNDIVSDLPRYKSTQHSNNNIYVDSLSDIYSIRALANHISYPLCFELPKDFSQKHQFLLFPMIKDEHASTMIIIFDNERNHVLAGIFINSRNSFYYNDMVKPYWDISSQEMPEFVAVGTENKYNLPGLPKEAFEILSKQAIDADTKPPIDQDYIQKSWFISNALNIRFGRKIPLVNASHNLQIGLGDKNCSLYSINFLEGIQKLLLSEGPGVYKLAKQLDEGNSSEKQQATQKLEEIFQNKLKKYLPCYYDTNLERKTSEQIKEFHIHQRWDIGSDFIKSLDLLKKARIL